MNNKNLISLVLILVSGLLIGGAYVKYTAIPCSDNPTGNTISDNGNISKENNLSDTADTIEAKNNDGSDKSENTNTDADITYATFSSPKANFTFEYPDMWVYDEREINGTMAWRFYSKFANNHDGVPYLEVHFPIDDPGAVSFSTGEPDPAKGLPLRPYHFAISVFATNDSETFVTYQWSGREALENGSGYIYWEKGQYFANSSYLSGHKYNYMRIYSILEKGQEIGLHIAQSIKIK